MAEGGRRLPRPLLRRAPHEARATVQKRMLVGVLERVWTVWPRFLILVHPPPPPRGLEVNVFFTYNNLWKKGPCGVLAAQRRWRVHVPELGMQKGSRWSTGRDGPPLKPQDPLRRPRPTKDDQEAGRIYTSPRHGAARQCPRTTRPLKPLPPSARVTMGSYGFHQG